MRSETLTVPTKWLKPLSAMSGWRRSAAALLTLTTLGACIGRPIIVATPSSCSTLVPSAWRTPVPGAPLTEGTTVADWIAFADTQTGQLDKANGRTVDTLDIISRCEARDRAAVVKPKFLGVL